ncbi:hypothetical protein P280DRAFT_317681 [Massarina eburnea CBS 473.64]|uniref:Uncharacterized protein n=1 Tax=Massarina eburnea CBS 473.64 TaxID=1395130 RepID=A0A6A6S195_9PLEO|nr:hypothetical protein P280DRAFT_317681 [Massarina eburnea CBS 473.64]
MRSCLGCRMYEQCPTQARIALLRHVDIQALNTTHLRDLYENICPQLLIHSFTIMTRVNDTLDIALPIRALIIGYRVQMRLGWTDISQKLGVRPDTAQHFYERTRELAGSEDLYGMLSYLDPLPSRHHEVRIHHSEHGDVVWRLRRSRPISASGKRQLSPSMRLINFLLFTSYYLLTVFEVAFMRGAPPAVSRPSTAVSVSSVSLPFYAMWRQSFDRLLKYS